MRPVLRGGLLSSLEALNQKMASDTFVNLGEGSGR